MINSGAHGLAAEVRRCGSTASKLDGLPVPHGCSSIDKTIGDNLPKSKLGEAFRYTLNQVAHRRWQTGGGTSRILAVLCRAARLGFENECVELKPGDFANIPALQASGRVDDAGRAGGLAGRFL